jgi:hypothetical protein
VENIPSFFYIRLAKSTKKAKWITQAFPESKRELKNAWGQQDWRNETSSSALSVHFRVGLPLQTKSRKILPSLCPQLLSLHKTAIRTLRQLSLTHFNKLANPPGTTFPPPIWQETTTDPRSFSTGTSRSLPLHLRTYWKRVRTAGMTLSRLKAECLGWSVTEYVNFVGGRFYRIDGREWGGRA